MLVARLLVRVCNFLAAQGRGRRRLGLFRLCFLESPIDFLARLRIYILDQVSNPNRTHRSLAVVVARVGHHDAARCQRLLVFALVVCIVADCRLYFRNLLVSDLKWVASEVTEALKRNEGFSAVNGSHKRQVPVIVCGEPAPVDRRLGSRHVSLVFLHDSFGEPLSFNLFFQSVHVGVVLVRVKLVFISSLVIFDGEPGILAGLG